MALQAWLCYFPWSDMLKKQTKKTTEKSNYSARTAKRAPSLP